MKLSSIVIQNCIKLTALAVLLIGSVPAEAFSPNSGSVGHRPWPIRPCPGCTLPVANDPTDDVPDDTTDGSTSPLTVETHDITFCTTTGGKDMQMDFYPATAGTAPYPLVVVVHGGGFVKGEKETAEGLRAQPGLNERGISVMAVNYRYSSEASLEYIAGDIKCSIRYARRNAAYLNINPDLIGITGSSAGGYLANLTATIDENSWDARDYVDAHDGYSSAVQSLVDWYGATDVSYESTFGVTEETYDATYGFDGFPEPVIEKLLGVSSIEAETEEGKAILLSASPADNVDALDPPALIMNGMDDLVIPYEQAQMFYDAYMAAGAQAELVLVENAMHGFVPTDGTDSNPTFDEIVEMTEEWFEATLVP